jgi:release factor glutamine methyltransferase
VISTSSSDSETVGGLLRHGTETLRKSGSESPRLDAELLLGYVLRVDRTSLLAAPEARVGVDHAAQFHDAVERRSSGEPVAYIRGIKEFFGLALSVDPRALIPRPETELLVELGLSRLRYMLTERSRPASGDPLLVWDVGTGSGAIVVAMAVEARRRGYRRDVLFRATDVSADALSVATINAVSHGVADQIEFAVADLTELASPASADLLVANLPYVPSGTVRTLPVAASFEPIGALDGGADGLDVARRLLAQLEGSVAADGIAMLEIGAGQAEALQEAVLATIPEWTITLHADLAGIQRVAELERSGGHG